MRRVFVIIALVAVFAVAAVPILGSATSTANGTGSTSAQSLSQQTTVSTGEVMLTVSATGKLVVKQQTNLSFDQSGQVKEVLVNEGDQVKAGQVLARQDDTTQQASLAQANDAVTAANAALQKLLESIAAGDIAKAEANVKSAEANYSSKASSVNASTVKSYELQYEKAQAAAFAADYTRAGTGGQVATTDPTYQKAVAQVGAAQISAEIARLQWVQSQQGSSLLSATAQITYEQALLAQVKAGPTQPEIEAAQAALVTAQLERDQAQKTVDQTKLIAAFSGVISSTSVNAGEISSGTTMVLTDSSTLGADINVDEANIGQIQVGQMVNMTLDAVSGAKLTGKVEHIAETADTTASVITYVVHIALDPTQAAIKPGMTANATLVVQDLKNVLRVPNNYLKTNRTTNQSTVSLKNPNGTVTTVPVKVGLQGSDYSEVIDGLRAGDTIALITSSSTTTSNNG